MSSNNSTIQDIDGDYSDWIELYNNSNVPINLMNYSITDDHNESEQWIFPNVVIPPNDFLLIFASDKDIHNLPELHTNFKISSAGEGIFLYSNMNNLIDQINPISLNTDQSYGKVPDGSQQHQIIDNPSPKTSNNYANTILSSHQQGFYTEPFYLKLKTTNQDSIFYTLDGSIPTDNDYYFDDSIFLNYRDGDPNYYTEFPTTPLQEEISYKAWESPQEEVNKATIIRFASYKNGVLSSDIYSKSFFVDQEIHQKYTMPIVSLITHEGNLFNSDTGIYVPGIYYDENNPEWSGNYFNSGDDWERSVNIAYFDQNGLTAFSQDAGIRIHGGKTRQASQKSLRLYARQEYGKKHFDYQIFPQREHSEYKRFILRTTMGGWHTPTIIKDVLAHEISKNLNIDYQDYRPVIVYLNGEYWGIHTMRDRIDERYIEYLHGIDKDDVEFKESSHPDYTDLLNYIDQNDLSINTHYDYVETKIDMDNYIDYTIAELFFANYDWPANNMKLWKAKTDGKWRWVFYDLDAGYSDINMLEYATKVDSNSSAPDWKSPTFLFRQLLKNKNFKAQFINRYVELLKTSFDPLETKAKYLKIKSLYAPEINDHVSRWNFPPNKQIWLDETDKNILEFLQERPCSVKSNLMEFFNLETFSFNCNGIAYTGDQVSLAPNPNNGNFLLYNHGQDIENATIQIANLQGQIVHSESNIEIEYKTEKLFNLSSLRSGTYIIMLNSQFYVQQFKFIVQ